MIPSLLELGLRRGRALAASCPVRKMLRGPLHDTLRLKNGRAVWIRPVRADDGGKMQDMVRGASLKTRYHRFFYAAHELPTSMLSRFSEADPLHALTLLATVLESGEETVVGMAQYVADESGQRAEFAVMITDAWQRHGIARRMMQNLECIAQRAGVMQLHGEVLAENEAMQVLMTQMDYGLSGHADGPHLLRVRKTLFEPAACSPLALLVEVPA